MTPQQFRRLMNVFSIALTLLVGFFAFANVWDMRGRTKDASLDLLTQMQPFTGDEDLAKMMVLVDIDEQSLQQIGQWPWPRSVTAELIDRMNAAAPLAIGLDILMTEEDRFTPANIGALSGRDAATFEGLVPDGDADLAAALQRAPTVLALNLVEFQHGNPLYAPASVAQIGTQNDLIISSPGVLSPTPRLQTSPGAGFVNLSLVRDNNVRKVPLIAKTQGKVMPSFAIEMLRVAQGARSHVAKLAGDTGNPVTQVKSGRVIATGDDLGFITLHHGYSDRFTVVSAATIMNNDDGAGWAEELNNGFVVLGSTASGLKDIHATSLEASLPGPFIHLQVLHQILSERHIASGEIYAVLELGAAILATIIMVMLASYLPLTISVVTLLAVAAGATYGYVHAFEVYGYLGNIFLAVGLITIMGMLNIAVRAIYEEIRRRKLRNAFNQYLSPEMVRRIDASGTGPSLGGTTTPISVMFMDVRGFTTMSEALAGDPATLTQMVNMIMDKATAVILDHGGTLDKYIGDALMAFWNAPMPQDDHARRAIDAAIALEAALPDINADLKTLMGDKWPGQDIRIGIGIATGEAVVGNMGSQFRFSYSCIGDIVNLAARLEPFGKNTGLPITLSDVTADQGAHPDLLAIDTISVRGKSQETTVYSPVVLDDSLRRLHQAYMDARHAFTQGTGTKAAITKALNALKKADGYPQSLRDYYSR